MILPFHSPKKPPGTFVFSTYLGLSLFSSHSSGALLFSEDARVIVASLFSSFFQMPSLLMNANSLVEKPNPKVLGFLSEI